jgi:hypothetical protein
MEWKDNFLLEFSRREWQILLIELAVTATETQESGNNI